MTTDLLGSLASMYTLDNPSGRAHCPPVDREYLTRVSPGKPILSELAVLVLRGSPRMRACPILVDLEGDRHAESHTTKDILSRGAGRTCHAHDRHRPRTSGGRRAVEGSCCWCAAARC